MGALSHHGFLETVSVQHQYNSSKVQFKSPSHKRLAVADYNNRTLPLGREVKLIYNINLNLNFDINFGNTKRTRICHGALSSHWANPDRMSFLSLIRSVLFSKRLHERVYLETYLYMHDGLMIRERVQCNNMLGNKRKGVPLVWD